jgi:quercetin dioxygenase-like cupin family protein
MTELPFKPNQNYEGLGPVGDRVLLENASVRVWIVDLPPGGVQAWHRHDLPYIVIPLTDGRNQMTFRSGRVVQTEEKPGMALWREPGEPHELLNTSDWRYQNILVEIKSSTADPTE